MTTLVETVSSFSVAIDVVEGAKSQAQDRPLWSSFSPDDLRIRYHFATQAWVDAIKIGNVDEAELIIALQ